MVKVKVNSHYSEKDGILDMPNAEYLSAPDAEIKCLYSPEAERYAVASNDNDTNFYASFIDSDGTLTFRYVLNGLEKISGIDVPKDRRFTVSELEKIHLSVIEKLF